MKRSVIQRKLGRADRAVDRAIEKAEMPGAVVLARMPVEGERVEHEIVRGLAVVRPERVPMTRQTIFDLASLTKPMATTTAILLLAADGLLDLDDPVAKSLPSFGEREKEAVTIRHLLTHASGLKPWRGFHEDLIAKERKTGEQLLGTPEGREWILDRILRSGLVHEPGEAAVYGDLDFIALGAVVEALAQQPLDVFCRERIFEPLGLADTGFLPGSDLQRRIAATENCPWRSRIVWGEVHDPNAAAMGGVAGHAGLFSTADDVMTLRADLSSTSGTAAATRCRATLRRALLASASTFPPARTGPSAGTRRPPAPRRRGATSRRENSIGHLGFTGTSLWIDLEREAIVVMLTNRVHLVAKKSRFDLAPRRPRPHRRRLPRRAERGSERREHAAQGPLHRDRRDRDGLAGGTARDARPHGSRAPTRRSTRR